MSHRIIRSLLLLSVVMLFFTSGRLSAQCADTQPVITGSQVVTNNQAGVVYSTPNIPGHTYAWSITGGNIIAGAGTNQVSVTWGSVGNGTISVQETNPLVPCSTTVSKTISVQPLLISYFYYTNTSCYGDVVSFHDASVYDAAFPITNYSWNFGDGNTSTLQNPTHQYLPPYMMTWTVTLITTNSIGFRDTIYDAVYVNPNQFIPTASFSSNIPNCLYDPVVFDAASSTTPLGTGHIWQWVWNFGDPASGTSNTLTVKDTLGLSTTATHVFSGPGTYTISLEVTNQLGCKSSTTNQIVITPSVPTSQFVYSTPSCLYNPVSFTNQATSPTGHNIVRYEWNFADGSMPVTVTPPASPDVTHIFPGLGPYQVQLKVYNDLGCVDSIRKAVTLDPSPLANFSWDSKCFGDTIKFENLTLQNNGPAITSYWWDFGDPGSGYNNSASTNPSHVFSTTGTFNVTLRAVNSSGCPDTVIKQLTMFPPPTCDYTWDYGTVNQQIVFHIDSSATDWGAIGNMVFWNFGDGSFGYGWNPIHLYPTGGTYDVTLTVTDTIGCKGTVVKQIFVPALPMAFFSSNSPVCDSLPVCFTDLSHAATPPFGYITRWIWDFGDATPPDTINFPDPPNVCHVYPNPDTFAVTLTVFDNFGFYDSYSADVIVLPNPKANFFYSSTLCPDQMVNFTDASTANGGGNIISWSWDFDDPGSGPDNYSNLQNPSHIFANGDSTYYVRLIVVNFNNCTDTMTKPVYIHPKPTVEFTYDTACLNQLVHFTVDTNITHLDSIASWAWNFGDGTPTIIGQINTAHLFSAVGMYTVTLTVTDIHGCMNSVSHTIYVNPLPVAMFTWNEPVCEGQPVLLDDQSFVNNIFSGYIARWYWEFGDGTDQNIVLPGSPDVTHTFAGGSYSYLVRLTVWTNDSCSSYVEHTITISPKPTANFTYTAVNCSSQPVQFTDQTQPNGGGALTQWLWDFGDPASGTNNSSPLQNPQHTFTQSGTFTVLLKVTNVNGCFDTISKKITINVKPVANFSADTACFNSPTQFTDLSVPNATSILTYSWDFGDGSPLSNQANPSHTYGNYGLFNVTLSIVNSNGCTHSITKQVLVNPLPTAAFTFTTPNCVGAPVCYTNLSTTPPNYLGNIVRWFWEFGDGTFSDIKFPNNPDICHVFSGSALNHIVRLTVTTSDSCTHFIEHTVTSVPSPVANFSYSTVNCAGQSVDFTDQTALNGGGPILSWDWNFGDPASGTLNFSTLKNPSHIFGTPGPYTVTLIVKNSTNCTDTITSTIQINQLPVADFSADTACVGSPTSFTDLSIPNATSIVNWTWDFGDGSPVNHLSNPVYAYATYGIYTVTLTITNSNGCISTKSKQVLVNPLPVAAFTYPATTCQGAPICFDDVSTTPPGYIGRIDIWQWDFGDGTITPPILFPANPDICHTFPNTSLNFTVRLTVTTTDGCVHFIEHQVSLTSSPVANFSWSNINCQNTPVLFSDQSAENGGGPVVSWIWNFDDPGSGSNNVSYQKNPAHSFTTPGTFDVTLIVNNISNCSDTIQKQVTINQLPTAAFNADTACVGGQTSFTDQSIANSGTITSWLWNFGDGSPTNTQKNPKYTYATYGQYTVTLTVTNSSGCTHTTTKNVLVLPLPTAAFSFSTPTCKGAPVSFQDLSTTIMGYPGAIVKWKWEFGDGSPVQTIYYPNNPDVTHTFAGTALSYNVKLTVTTATPDSCTDMIIQTVTLISSPLANFSYPAQNCEQQSVAFTDQTQLNGGGPLVTWNWDFGDPGSGSSNTSNAKDPVHLFSTNGGFTVTLIVANSSGCTDTIQKSLWISGRPVANFHADTACQGNLTAFTDLSTPADSIASHFWEFGDGGTDTQKDPTHLFANPGNYNVKLTVTTSKGCKKDTTMQIIVHPVPTAAFSFTPSTCVGDSVQFTDLSTTPGAAIVKWYWEFGDGSDTTIWYPDSPNVKHGYASGGSYIVNLTVTTSDSCSDSQQLTVVVVDKPMANFEFSTTKCEMMPLQFTDLSQATGGIPVVSWLWDFGDPASGTNNSSTLKNPTHSFTDSGSFNVFLTVTNANGCNDTITKVVDVNARPTAWFVADTACVGFPTQFADSSYAGSGTLVTWLWDFGDPPSGTNNNSTEQNPTHIFTSPGTFSVSLQVTNSNSCIHDTVMQVSVSPSPDAMFSYSATCVADSTLFTDLSIAPGSQITDWLWDFGDPASGASNSSTNQNPKHAFMTGGTYNVKLVVTNLGGCQDSITIPVIARPKPVADYSYTNFFCPAGQVVFQDLSQGVGASITERLWIFEPGYTSDLINPTHVFSQTNTTFPVTLIVTDNNGCQDTITDNVFVKPGFSFTFDFDTVCYGAPTNFDTVNLANGDQFYNPEWDFGDPASGPNNKSYLYSPNHIFTAPGNYVVKLKITNSDNCVDSVFRYVLVRPLPEPAFTYTSTPCESTLYFTDASSATEGTIASWTWDYGDGSPPETILAPGPGDAQHLYNDIGSYKVILTVTNSFGCSDTVSMIVERYPCVLATFDVNDPLCSRYPITFTDNSYPTDNINQWIWTFGDGTDTTYTTYSDKIVHIYADSGTYTVKLKISAFVSPWSFVDSLVRTVTIRPTPVTLFSNQGVCLNKITLFRDTTNDFGMGFITRLWNFGDPGSGTGDTSTFINPTHKYDTAGTYDVKLIVTNGWGCTDSLIKPTRVYGLPQAHFENTVACTGNPTEFSDISIDADTTMATWAWNFGDLTSIKDTSNLQDPVYIYKGEGNYSVRMIVQDNFGCKDTVDSTIRVNITPVAAFTLSNNLNGMTGKIQLNNLSSGADAYEWEFGNGTSSTDENPVATYDMDGTYLITLVSYNEFNCTDTSYYKYEVLFKTLYIPNAFSPTNSNLAVRLFKPVGKNLKQYSIQVYDYWGHMMWQSTALDSEGAPLEGWDGTYNGNMMPQGTYMWKASATFIDDTIWQGNDIGVGEPAATMGVVSLIR